MSCVITRPISRLIDAVNRFGKGYADIRAEVQSDDEIGLLAASFNRMADSLCAQTQTLEDKIQARTQELKILNEELKTLSVRDPLTGCYNRRFLLERLEIEIARASRHGLYLAVILCDLDHFKLVNDTYGHQMGDKVLRSFVQILQGSTRENVDWSIRYGGEEFLLILPETNLEGAGILAERLRSTFANLHLETDSGQEMSCTASFGVTSVDFARAKDSVSIEQILSAADELLYLAKESGRNVIICKSFAELLPKKSSC